MIADKSRQITLDFELEMPHLNMRANTAWTIRLDFSEGLSHLCYFVNATA